MPSHYLNQCWNIINWTLGNKLQWILHWNLYIFIQKNAFEIVVRKLPAFFSQPQCVKQPVWQQSDAMFKNWGPLAGILTHWGRVTSICVSKLTIISSDNSLSPGRRQAIIWTNDRILLIGPLGTNFNIILIESHTFSFTNSIWKCCLEYGGHFISTSMC